jgi:UDP-N-acetylglucosamine transferase subunit ALG13
MILITVGTEKFPFNRLLQWVDYLIQQQFINPHQEKVLIQYGSCTFLPQGGEKYQVLPEADFKTLLDQARLIISHCGEGSFDILAKLNKPFILVPRSHGFAEHVDNHQVELAQALADKGVPIAYTPGDLVRFLANPIHVAVPAPSEYYAQASQWLTQTAQTSSRRRRSPAYPGWISTVVEFAKGLARRLPGLAQEDQCFSPR